MDILYPSIEPYNSFSFPVSERHTLYVEECGNPNGTPVVFLHGGPGGGISPDHRRYFDPKKWRVILFDQRGSGKSTPHADLVDNTTWDLVADIEKIREKLKIDKWTVFGGSWGSTLSLSYAVTHPERVRSLILRGIFLIRDKEISWFYQEGASRIFPDLWEAYLKPIPVEERNDLVRAYHRRLTSPDANVRKEAAKAWSIWEGSTSKLIFDSKAAAHFEEDEFAEAFARIECHYFTNKGFFPYDGWLLDQARLKLQNIPTVIVQGRYDVVCPAESAYDLAKAMPKAELIIVADAGHSMSESGIAKALVEATNRG
jgi:proline iminopeptidase